MKKTLRKKKTLFSCLVPLLILCGCASIDVKQDFDFTVQNLPYGNTLTEGVPAEVRFEIMPGEDLYLCDCTRYYVRYFPSAGSGTLRVGQDTALVPNDLYRLPNHRFRMYYLPDWGTASAQHTLLLTFMDNWGHTQETTLQFNVQEDEDDNTILSINHE